MKILGRHSNAWRDGLDVHWKRAHICDQVGAGMPTLARRVAAEPSWIIRTYLKIPYLTEKA
jgi:hypothetical protein